MLRRLNFNTILCDCLINDDWRILKYIGIGRYLNLFLRRTEKIFFPIRSEIDKFAL